MNSFLTNPWLNKDQGLKRREKLQSLFINLLHPREHFSERVKFLTTQKKKEEKKKGCGKFNHQLNKSEKQSPTNEDVAEDNGAPKGDAIVSR